MNTFDMYNCTEVQNAIDSNLKKIRGVENREDAKQEAYHAIADEGPLTVEDAATCVKRAIHRYRMRLCRASEKDAEGWVSNKDRLDIIGERDYYEWMNFATHYLGVDDDEYDNSGIIDSTADTRSYDTADFPIRRRAFV